MEQRGERSCESEVHVSWVRGGGTGAPSVGVQLASCIGSVRCVVATQCVPVVEYGREPCRVHERGVLLMICAEAALGERTSGGAVLRGERLQLWEFSDGAVFLGDEK